VTNDPFHQRTPVARANEESLALAARSRALLRKAAETLATARRLRSTCAALGERTAEIRDTIRDNAAVVARRRRPSAAAPDRDAMQARRPPEDPEDSRA